MTEARTDVELARQIAITAGELPIALRRSGRLSTRRSARPAPRSPTPLQALADARPDDGVLSEEETASAACLDKRRVWIGDPLNGTREYSEGRADWAVHVAFSIDRRAESGAVALPAWRSHCVRPATTGRRRPRCACGWWSTAPGRRL